MKQNQIQFFKTMTSKKRGDGAYLRKNILNSDEAGLYPAVDFINKKFASTPSLDSGFLIKNDYVFVEDGSNTAVYRNTTSSELVFLANMPDSTDPVAVVETNINNKILVLLSSGNLYSVQNTTITLIHTFSGDRTPAYMVYNGFYHFISVDTKIYRLDPDLTTVSLVKNTTAQNQSEIIDMQIFNDYIIMVRSLGKFVQFDFWSITDGDVDLYQKRVVETNCRHLALGMVDGVLVFVKSVGNSANAKEKRGNIVVTAFDGEKFKFLNSIRAGDDTVYTSGGQAQSIGNGVMILALSGNEENSTETLFKDWILKIKNNGSIETLFEPNDITDGSFVSAINIEYDSISMLFEKNDGDVYFYQTRDTSSSYTDYTNFTKSEYATNFLNNTKNVHQLISFGVSFEKVFDQLSETRGERLYIDYRTSERDSWALLHEVNTETIKNYTADKYLDTLRQTEYDDDGVGQTIQSYVIKKLPDNSELPRFNEIQFRFRSKKGFSLLQAWYNYKYIKRNTI